MFKKIVLTLAIFALVASAGSVPAGKATFFTVNLVQPATVQGQELKAGEYRLSLVGDKLTMVKGKQTVEVYRWSRSSIPRRFVIRARKRCRSARSVSAARRRNSSLAISGSLPT
jgi:hypothetical protein